MVTSGDPVPDQAVVAALDEAGGYLLAGQAQQPGGHA